MAERGRCEEAGAVVSDSKVVAVIAHSLPVLGDELQQVGTLSSRDFELSDTFSPAHMNAARHERLHTHTS